MGPRSVRKIPRVRLQSSLSPAARGHHQAYSVGYGQLGVPAEARSRDFFDQGNSGCTSRVSSALGFPSKRSAEIAPDHRKSSEGTFCPANEDSMETRFNIALCLYYWYFSSALGNGGNRFPLPAPAPESPEIKSRHCWLEACR